MLAFLDALLNLYLPEPVVDRRGQGLVEYALIIVLIAIAVIAAMTLLGGQVRDIFDEIRASLAV